MTTTPPLPSVPVRSAAELTQRWTALLDPPVFGARSLWLSWIGDDGLMLPMVIPVDDLPELPDPGLLKGLREVNDGVLDAHLDGEGHLAMALCRPGGPEATDDDYEWAEDLRSEIDDHLDGTWSLHLAAGGHVSELVAPPPGMWPR